MKLCLQHHKHDLCKEGRLPLWHHGSAAPLLSVYSACFELFHRPAQQKEPAGAGSELNYATKGSCDWSTAVGVGEGEGVLMCQQWAVKPCDWVRKEATGSKEQQARTGAVTDWEEGVKCEGEFGRRISPLGAFLLKMQRRRVIFQSRHVLLSANICKSQRRSTDLCGNSTWTSISRSGRDVCGRPKGLLLISHGVVWARWSCSFISRCGKLWYRIVMPS